MSTTTEANAPSQQPSEPSERPAKRTKIRLACQECRDRKIRCDGGRPVCSSCARKRLGPEQCIYLEPSSEVTPSYVRSLESRIRELEGIRGHENDVVRDHTPFTRSRAPGSSQLPQISRQDDDHMHISGVHEPQMLPPSQPNDTERSLPSIQHVFSPSYSTPRDVRNGSMLPKDVNGHHGDISFPDTFAAEGPAHRLDAMVIGQHQESHERGNRRGLLSQSEISFTFEESNSAPEKTRTTGGQESLPQHLSAPGADKESPTHVASAMGATEGTPPSATNAGSVFLGPSSAAAFMKEVRETYSARKRTHPEFVVDDAASSTASRASRPQSQKEKDLVRTMMEELVLPPRRIADIHLNNYWAHVHPLYPILHKPSFMKRKHSLTFAETSRYERIWMHDPVQEHGPDIPELPETVHSLRAFFSTFNTVLALGSRYSVRAETSHKTKLNADTFFERSQQLITPESPDHGSLQLVQALILSAQYLQGSDMVNRCWVTVGLAIRVAQGIGIHLDSASESQAEREERRRTWWCCILMDRVLSMTFGRPPMVVWPSIVPFPAIIDDENLSMEPSSSSVPLELKETSKVAFFIHALKLSNILMDVLKHFYAPRGLKSGVISDGFHPKDCSALLEFDSRIGSWKTELPTYLHYCSNIDSNDSESMFRIQAVVLHCRYLHLKILLFRPIMVDLAESQFFNPTSIHKNTILKQGIATSCIRSCVAAAKETIDVLYAGSGRGHLPVWWYSVFYLYTAGTVILAVLLTPSLRQAEQEHLSSLERSWTHCLECLSYFAHMDGTFAKRCLSMLRTARNSATFDRQIDENGQFVANISGESTQLQQDQGTRLYRETHRPDSCGRTPFEQNEQGATESAFIDSWWPTGGLDWLNSIPTDFSDNAQISSSFHEHYGDDVLG